MLSTKSNTSWFSSSRKYSATVRPVKTDAQTGAGWLVHLAIDQRGFGLGEVVRIDDFRLLHFVPEVVAFTGPLTDAGEHGESTVVQGDIVDELHDDDGLADSGAAEEADLAALAVGFEKIDDFDAGFEDFGLGVLIFELRSAGR